MPAFPYQITRRVLLIVSGNQMSKIIMISVMFLFCETASGQDSLFSISGQLNGYTGLSFSDPIKLQAGVRIIPSVSIVKKLNNNLKFDSEIAVNTYADFHFTDWVSDLPSDGLKPYRLWVRFSSERLEIRAGLQKINFGSASFLRPLMWFDKIDPRDPLQLTDGVYGLLGRYYFKNNANVWLWTLLGNDKTRGWEMIPSKGNIPEFGGRLQIPVPKGETAISYHHRIANLAGSGSNLHLHGSPTYSEDRIGLDGKWDLGVGLWFEGTITRSYPDSSYFNPWSEMGTLGIDYTFPLGNGLYAATELFSYNEGTDLFRSDSHRTFSSFTLNYPFGINKIGSIINYSWTDKSWYRFINIQRQNDKWTFYLFLFWNPDRIAIYNNGSDNNDFAGTGIRIMAVYNF